MKWVLTGKQMRKLDTITIRDHLMSGLVLMERAAIQVYQTLKDEKIPIESTLIVCGNNNNGGDGLALARLMIQDNHHVDIVLEPSGHSNSQEVAQQLLILSSYGIKTITDIPEKNYSVIIDCLLGTGLDRDITGNLAEDIRKLNQMSGYKVSIDIPTGVHATTGKVMGIAFHSDLTVSLAYIKLGTLLFPGADYAGKIVTVPIGICGEQQLKEDLIQSLEWKDREMVPRRKKDGNKATFGKILVIAGSQNIFGAAYFSAKSCLLSGAGMVKVISHENNRSMILSKFPEALFESLPLEENFEEFYEKQLEWADIVILGPGIGTSDDAKSVVFYILKHAKVPVILDADGLNCIKDDVAILKDLPEPLILTPHIGEMARLLHCTIDHVKSDVVAIAQEFSRSYNVICVLKDSRTVIASPDGTTFLNLSGTNGMATAGSGDVLTGVIAGFCAQNMPLTIATSMSVFCHGLAGQAAAKEIGTRSICATDIMNYMNEILKEIE